MNECVTESWLMALARTEIGVGVINAIPELPYGRFVKDSKTVKDAIEALLSVGWAKREFLYNNCLLHCITCDIPGDMSLSFGAPVAGVEGYIKIDMDEFYKYHNSGFIFIIEEEVFSDLGTKLALDNIPTTGFGTQGAFDYLNDCQDSRKHIGGYTE